MTDHEWARKAVDALVYEMGMTEVFDPGDFDPETMEQMKSEWATIIVQSFADALKGEQ